MSAIRHTLLRFTFYILLGSAFLVFAPATWAQTVTDDQVNEVAHDLYCPVCENTPLDVCHTQACADWRALIRTQLSEGRSKQEILDYFALQYGDGVLAEPPRRGVHLVLWLFPVVALLVGAVFFSRYMRDLRNAAEPTRPKRAKEPAQNLTVSPSVPAQVVTPQVATSPASLEEYIARVEEELRR